MGNKEKIKKLEELFDKIKELFPNNSASLSLHKVNLDDLPEGWDIDMFLLKKRGLKSAVRKGKSFFDITLFG